MNVTLATAEDIIGIVYVQATTWIATYQSDAYDVLESDLRAIDWQGKIPAWQHMVKSSDYNVYVIKDNSGNVQAFASVLVDDGVSWLLDMYVLPELQQRGIGTELMKRVLDDAEGPINLHVAEYNQSAIDFYTSFGFAPTTGVGRYELPNNKSIPTIEMRYMPKSKDQDSSKDSQKVSRAKLAQLLNERESTIKWYSELGLLPFEQAGEGLRRYFDVELAREHYTLIKRLQSEGYSLEEIADYWQSA